MNRTRPSALLVAVAFVGYLSLSCGSGPSRQLQSISISAVQNGSQITFVATGTYNVAPTTVSPLPVTWYVMDPSGGYSLSPRPYVFVCGSVPATGVTAIAPANPNAPSVGSALSTKMVVGSAPLTCP